MADRSRREGVRGGSAGRKIPWDGSGGGIGAGGRSRDGRGKNCGTVGADVGKMETTEKTATAASRRRIMNEDPPVSMQDKSAREKYRLGRKVTKESADKSA